MLTSIRIVAMIALLVCIISVAHDTNSYGDQGESIVYVIKPSGGKATYWDLGLTDLEGRKVKLTVFETHALGFKDTEKIYSDQETMLPIRVERDIRKWIGREYIIEDYDQEGHKVTIAKFKGKKKVGEQVFSADGRRRAEREKPSRHISQLTILSLETVIGRTTSRGFLALTARTPPCRRRR